MMMNMNMKGNLMTKFLSLKVSKSKKNPRNWKKMMDLPPLTKSPGKEVADEQMKEREFKYFLILF